METKQEWCPRHGYSEFFLATGENDSCASLHCPECFPELFAELTAIDAAIEQKRKAANAVTDSIANLIHAVREVVAKGKSAPVSSRMALVNALASHDEAVAYFEAL